jgi:hypothetical protein
VLAEYRFLRTRDGLTWFADVTVVSAEASAWSITRSDAIQELEPVYGEAIERGLALAMAEQQRRNGPSFAIAVSRLIEAVVDTSADVVECAVAVAAWKSFGNEEREVSIDFEEGRWTASFR